MGQLVTYLGDATLKARLLAEIGQHEAADAIAKGSYGTTKGGQWRGCAIGCSLRSLNAVHGDTDLNLRTDVHDRYEAELGLPVWLAHLEDYLFESLPDDLAMTWPRRFADAVPVGAVVDDVVLAKILRWTLGADTYGVRHAATDAAVVAVVDRMIALFDREIRGDSPSATDWADAARAARAAGDAWAARDAWAAWDARAARAAGDAWAARAAWAAWDAWDARAAGADARDAWDARAAWAAARDAFYPALSDYVLELLRALPASARS